MKKSVLAALLVAGITMVFTPKTLAADAKTLTGEGKCAKCALKETKECQNTVTVKEGDKSVTYYMVKNTVSDDFHSNICKGPKKVKATGTVKEVDGKMQLTATKIDLVKD
jgi:RecG-like helicase